MTMPTSQGIPQGPQTLTTCRYLSNKHPRVFRNRRAAAHNNVPSDPVDTSWYSSWLLCQLEHLPNALRELLLRSTATTIAQAAVEMSVLIEKFVHRNKYYAIDEIIESLHNAGFWHETDPGSHAHQRRLVFAVLGWKSMLYQPSLNTCSHYELAIQRDDKQPDSGMVFDTYRVPADLSDRPLYVLLKAFGNLLPAPPQITGRRASEIAREASSWTRLFPNEFNAYLLQSLLGVRFHWVDSLALHLDFDKSTRTLCLFAFPSHCVHMLRSRGAIFAFASTASVDLDPRADESDIESLLREVLISYRLLFGQSSKARKVFRAISEPSNLPFPQMDTLLFHLCASKSLVGAGDDMPVDRAVYFAPRDFLVLCERLQLIQTELQNVKPHSVGDLVRDKRDMLQYWTFWLISLIGGMGIVLSLIQVVLQAIQLAQAGKSG